jgi:hypothetical protein
MTSVNNYKHLNMTKEERKEQLTSRLYESGLKLPLMGIKPGSYVQNYVDSLPEKYPSEDWVNYIDAMNQVSQLQNMIYLLIVTDRL